jgi:Spy/CpxP family protein refolding chaperone
MEIHMRKLLWIAAGTMVVVVITVVTGHAQRAGGPLRPNRPGVQAPGGPNGPAGPGPGRAQGQGPGQGQGDENILRGLDLTEAQRKQARDIMLKARDEAAPMTDQLQLARKDLRRAIFSDTRDSAKLKDLTAKMQTLQKQVADVRMKALTSISDMLTPEQRQQVRIAPGGALRAAKARRQMQTSPGN